MSPVVGVRPRRLSGDRGVTVTEVLTVVAISAVIATALVGVLQSSVTVERRLDTRATATAELERLFTSIGRDIDAGLPAVPTRTPPDAEILAIEVIDELGAATTVHWILADGELRRVVVDEATGATTDDDVLASGLLPVAGGSFTSYGAAGTVLSPADTTEAQRALCTTRYRIELALAATDLVVSDRRDLAVPLRTPGANRC
ncbi:MAG: type II secretion system protein J [Acidimicrobiales bacterium]